MVIKPGHQALVRRRKSDNWKYPFNKPG